MARRESTASLASRASSTSLLKSLNGTPRGSVASIDGYINGYAPQAVTRSTSASKVPMNGMEDSLSATTDPDELFVKYPVGQVKAIQNRLRADADAKQEELRQMVGERYRDLLQASTSIISLSASSRHVLEALEDMSDSVPSREQIASPVRPAHTRQDDAQLQSLQSLSTHIKLLLDAPEHIWRLLERKQYLRAAWLFLLARVVHRALVNDDADNEESWESYGIDVEEQFPLVQRQWETVSQFRSQITHKATLSLREHAMSSLDVCATLLTLHFLDSRPLVDTLSVLLAQRRRTLSSALAVSVSEKQGNGHPHGARSARNRLKIRKSVIQELKRRLQAVLDIISGTVSTARDIFQDHTEEHHQSTIRRALAFIQSDPSTSSTDIVPKDLQLTTPGVLTDLPSATQFLYLPQNIKAYKPYVDLTSASSLVQQPVLQTKVQDWFDSAIHEFAPVAEAWLEDLNSVEEVWEMRKMLLRWLRSTSRLQESERPRLRTVLDDLYRKRIAHLWEAAFTDVDRGFRDKLLSVIETLKESENDGSSKIDAFMTIPSLSIPPSSGFAVPDNDLFLKYKTSLRRHLSGRTPLLDQVLETLEDPVLDLRKSVDVVRSDKNDPEGSAASLLNEYRLGANTLCSKISDVLTSTLNSLSGGTDIPLHTVMFVGQVADALASTSEFAACIACSSEVAEAFRRGMRDLYRKSVDRWGKQNIELAVQEYWRRLPITQHTPNTFLIRYSEDVFIGQAAYSRPSAALMHCLSTLVASVQQIGMTYHSNAAQDSDDETLRIFIRSVISDASEKVSQLSANQFFSDLLFLRKLIELRGDRWHDISCSIDSTAAMLQQTYPNISSANQEAPALDYLLRTQLLLDPLLPKTMAGDDSRKQASLLRLGTPSSDSTIDPVIDLVKPTARFGLLLVENTSLQ